ncbi:RraA family protein [Martelella alba]|uniref:Putative 4-hydroxy-4-methyl-2-oxoglutarate aldolase n=1 Tax=Martelella alba TaxID=2590451 RepID=A0ABY2SGR8_9HYPH|nr:RraA family protein [Martelella alba]
MIETGNSPGVGHWGELMSHAALKQHAAGVIVNGGCRDIKEIKSLDFPVYCEYSSPYESGNKYCIGNYEIDITLPGIDGKNVVVLHYHDYVLADEDGIIVIEEKNLIPILNEAVVIWTREKKTIADIYSGTNINEAFIRNGVA